jgi:hypothetical protein
LFPPKVVAAAARVDLKAKVGELGTLQVISIKGLATAATSIIICCVVVDFSFNNGFRLFVFDVGFCWRSSLQIFGDGLSDDIGKFEFILLGVLLGLGIEFF